MRDSLPRKQLFHSQCRRAIEREHDAGRARGYDVYCISGKAFLETLVRLGPPLSGLASLADDHEGVVAAAERWICNRPGLVTWNVAMTGRR